MAIKESKTVNQLKRHEGLRLQVYKCTAGANTIGYGYNLDANPLNLSNYEINRYLGNGISKENAETMLKVQACQIEQRLCEVLPFFDGLNEARQAVLVNMCFNMGLNGLLVFKTTLAMVMAGDYHLAALNMLKSKWATQVHGRANELAEQMRTGEFA